MDEDRRLVRQEVEDLHSHLVESYELVESLVGRPGLTPALNEALSGLQYSVAKAAQDASRLHDNQPLWED